MANILQLKFNGTGFNIVMRKANPKGVKFLFEYAVSQVLEISSEEMRK